jgi:ankyrin repeat protein
MKSAIATENHDALQRLIAAGARVDLRFGEQFTYLHYAAIRGSAAVVRALVEAGAPVDARSVCGATPLAYAATVGKSIEVVRELVARGADVNAKSSSSRGKGLAGSVNVLYHATFSGNVAVMRALVAAGARHDSTLLLFNAVWRGNTDAVRFLIEECRADVNATVRGISALDLAARAKSGRVESTRLLLRAGAGGCSKQ